MFISVDFPAPFSPSSACTSPGRMSKSTWSFASTPGKRLVMPVIASPAAGSALLVRHPDGGWWRGAPDQSCEHDDRQNVRQQADQLERHVDPLDLQRHRQRL